MPFRSNMMGEQIAQPGTTHNEIDNLIMGRLDANDFDVHGADLFANGDDLFKFGGTLHVSLTIDSDEIDEETGEPEDPEYNDMTIEFDGFDTAEAAREWLTDLYPTIRPIVVD